MFPLPYEVSLLYLPKEKLRKEETNRYDNIPRRKSHEMFTIKKNYRQPNNADSEINSLPQERVSNLLFNTKGTDKFLKRQVIHIFKFFLLLKRSNLLFWDQIIKILAAAFLSNLGHITTCTGDVYSIQERQHRMVTELILPSFIMFLRALCFIFQLSL